MRRQRDIPLGQGVFHDQNTARATQRMPKIRAGQIGRKAAEREFENCAIKASLKFFICRIDRGAGEIGG